MASSAPAVADLPKRLRDDAIIEALCEFRFAVKDLPEIVAGRLADFPAWSVYRKDRLPIANVPEQIRAAEPELRFHPTLMLVSPDASRSVRIGHSVLSLHVSPKYCGWAVWKEEIRQTVGFLFDRLPGVVVTRIGLRYINALHADRHLVRGFQDLNLNIELSGKTVTSDVNLNVNEFFGKDVGTTTRIATRSMVEGNITPTASAIVDIDVYTPQGYAADSAAKAFDWIDGAHTVEKTLFFRLIPPDILNKIREA
jgi:uncharacterized protein (TIGR04255 family)